MVLLGFNAILLVAVWWMHRKAHMPQSLSQLAPYALVMLFAVSSERYVLISAIAISAIFNAPAALLVFDALYINLLISWEGYPVAGSVMILIQFAALIASSIVITSQMLIRRTCK